MLRQSAPPGSAGRGAPDVFVANSEHVAARIRRYYGREAEVVHPPVNIEHYLQHRARRRSTTSCSAVSSPTSGWIWQWLRARVSVGPSGRRGRTRDALEVRAAAAGHRRSSSSGASATPSATRCSSGARALLFPGEEDFGIVPVEAQAAGIPVIAYGVGGARRRSSTGSTGVLFDQQSPAKLAAAISASRGYGSIHKRHVERTRSGSAASDSA